MGAGERKKSIVGPVAVNVYAIGLYVDAGAAKAAGGGITDANSAAQVLKAGTFPKTLRLVMARTGKIHEMALFCEEFMFLFFVKTKTHANIFPLATYSRCRQDRRCSGRPA